ncbi:MAG TPA: hypothetical protein VMY40_04395 [Anaerolineae bacterium]|nr:hypothetical protein [Anaerolineae bacterium]
MKYLHEPHGTVEFWTWCRDKCHGNPVTMDLCASGVLPMLRLASRLWWPILELGGGAYSTFILHAALPRRKILTLETSREWYPLLCHLLSKNHEIRLVPNIADAVRWMNGWKGLVLVDHAPAEDRPLTVEQLRGQENILVCHDSDHPEWCGGALEGWKFRADIPWPRGATTVVSDSINVGEMLKDD